MLKRIAIFLITVLVCINCGKIGGPDGPEPPEVVEYYNYEITYIRTSIPNPSGIDPFQLSVYFKNGSAKTVNLVKIDEYKFVGEVPGIPTHLATESNLPPNYIYVVDSKRWLETIPDPINIGQVWGKPHSVGDVFILKNTKTSLEKQLLKIVDFVWPGAPPQCEPKRAQFFTKKGGIMKDEWLP